MFESTRPHFLTWHKWNNKMTDKANDSPISRHADALEISRIVGDDLAFIARSLLTIGLRDLAETLMKHNANLKHAEETARSAFHQITDERFKASQEASANLIKLAMAKADGKL